MDKAKLIAKVVASLEAELEVTLSAVKSAVEGATHEEARAENEYDTRGLEASYLAGAQTARAAEIEQAAHRFRSLPVRSFAGQAIAVGAVVVLDDGTRTRRYFVGPDSGGLEVEVDGVTYTVITLSAPLGKALARKEAGDFIEVATKGQAFEYEIAEVL